MAPFASADPVAPVNVNVELPAHDGSILNIPADWSASVYAGGSWQPITTTNSNNHSMVTTQLAPGSYAFAATYRGTRNQQQVLVGSTGKTVYFHTELANVELNAHNQSSLDIPGSGSASYYAGGWHAITAKNVNNPNMVQAEMLPGNYSFAVTYNGTREQKVATVKAPNANLPGNQNIQSIYFGTELVVVSLKAQYGGFLNLSGTNGSASYYAGGWRAMTTADPNNYRLVQAEMLPGSYSFAATYNGFRDQKVATVKAPNANLPANKNIQSVYLAVPVATS